MFVLELIWCRERINEVLVPVRLGGTDIRALRRASHGSDIDYNIQLSMAWHLITIRNILVVIVCFQ